MKNLGAYRYFSPFAAFVLVIVIGSPAGAAPVTFAFTAVAQNDYEPFYDIPAGAVVHGSYTFDSATMNSSGSATTAYYLGAIESFNIDLVGVGTAQNTGTTYIFVGDPQTIYTPDGPTYADYYHIDNVPMSPLVVGGLFGDNTLIGAFVTLQDNTQTAFSSDDLPLTPPNLAAFADSHELQLNFRTPSGGTGAPSFEFTSLTLVPEPGTLILAVLGGLALLAFRRR